MRIRRREFLTLVCAAAAWPIAAWAQQASSPMVGWLDVAGPPSAAELLAFRQGLNELGYAEGRNVVIELRSSEQYDDLPALASELVRGQVTVIFANTSPQRSQRGLRPQQYRSYLPSVATRSGRVWSPVSADQAAILLG